MRQRLDGAGGSLLDEKTWVSPALHLLEPPIEKVTWILPTIRSLIQEMKYASLFLLLSAVPAIALCCSKIEFQPLTEVELHLAKSCSTEYRDLGYVGVQEDSFALVFKLDIDKYLIYHRNIGCIGVVKLGGNLTQRSVFNEDSKEFEMQIGGTEEGTSYTITYSPNAFVYMVNGSEE